MPSLIPNLSFQSSLLLIYRHNKSALLYNHKSTIGWLLDDIHGINPSICTDRIHLEDPVKTSREPQRRLNPILKEAIRTEIPKLLDVGTFNPFFIVAGLVQFMWSLRNLELR